VPLPDEIRRRIDAIRRDRTSGAAALASDAADALALTADLAPERLAEAAHALAAAQPSMAPIVHLASAVLASPDPKAACADFASRLSESLPRVAAHGAGLVRDGITVMTHSASATVLEAVRAARRAGRTFDVICTESRPVREGVIMAGQIAREGIPVRLIVDAAIDLLLAETQLVLVGADSVSPAGLVNKAGTALLARAARARGVPVYALCGSEKFVPDPLPQDAKNPAEVLERSVPGITVVNRYFDSTPLDLLTGIVTETGPRPACRA
jgi:translation initiation factor 2B subunit (eIF-2B alpha/beta/delta family)